MSFRLEWCGLLGSVVFQGRDTFEVGTAAGLCLLVGVGTGWVNVLAHGGGVLLAETVRARGLDVLLSQVLAPWSRLLARHDPVKVVLDLALSLVVERAVVLARARRAGWTLAGAWALTAAVSAQRPLVTDTGATLVTAHPDNEGGGWHRPSRRAGRGFGLRPLTAWTDHGPQGAGENAAVMLRPASAGSDTAADHEAVIAVVLARVGLGPGPGRKVLVRTDAAGGTKATLAALERRGVSCSVGLTLPSDMSRACRLVPAQAWTPACGADAAPARRRTWQG